jgi:uncharacterized protein with PQ loop repeat
MHTEKIMGYMAVFFGILGSWGLAKQAWMIWVHKSAKSVSGVWVVTFLAMFTSFLIYGVAKHSFPMQFQGWLRVFFSLPVTLGFFVYGNSTRKDWSLTVVYSILLLAMSLDWAAPFLFVSFSLLGVLSSFVQAYTIYRNQSRGQVAVELQVIYLLAIVCWLVYGIVRSDVPLIVVSIGFVMSYSSVIYMWRRFP